MNVVCTSTSHCEAAATVTMYQLTSTAQQGVLGTSNYVKRQMSVSIANQVSEDRRMKRANFWMGALLLALFWSGEAMAAICTSQSAGTWNTAARWLCGGVARVPLATDTVVVAHNITLNIDTTVAGLTVNNAVSLIDNNANRILTITGNLVVNGAINTGGGRISLNITGAASDISGNGTLTDVRLYTSGAAPTVAAGSSLNFTGSSRFYTGRTEAGATVAGSVLTINGTINSTVTTASTTFLRLYANSTVVSSTGVINASVSAVTYNTAAAALTNNGSISVNIITQNGAGNSWTQGANASLTMTAASTVGTLNASANGNTVTYNGTSTVIPPSAGYWNLAGSIFPAACPHGVTVLGTDPCPAGGPTSVTLSPSNCVNVAGIGTRAWGTPAFAVSSNNAYATVSLNDGQVSNYLRCTNYGFAIPAGATINGVTVNVERKASVITSIQDAAMRLVRDAAGLPAIQATDRSTATAYTTVDVIEAHGGAADLWGGVWTAADINSVNFGAAFASQKPGIAGGARTVSVDHMPITVTYTYIVNPGDFNTYDTSTAPAGAIDGLIKTKVAGQSFSLDIAVLNVAKTALLTTYTQTVKVELLNTSSGGVLDANNCNAGWGTIQTLPNQTFAAGDAAITGSAGRHRVTGIVENNAWRNVAVRVSYPATGVATSIGCSTDHFAIRPASFSALTVSDTDWQTAGTARALTNTAASGGVMHKAGQPFTVQTTAVNAAVATTTNYVATPSAVACVRSGGVNVCNTSDLFPAGTAACSGTACIGTPGGLTLTAAVAGVINSTATTYSDVGSFTLQLQDTTFAQVDATDGTLADCTGQYVCSSTLDAGRFVPDHYTIIFATTNARLVNRSDIPACEIATTGDIVATTTALAVASSAGFAVGDQVLVAGAGVGGEDLISAITSIAGTAVTLATAASTGVTGAVVQKTGFSYMDEPLVLGFTIEAHNAADVVTQNYSGALANLDLAAPASFGFAAADGANYFLTTDRLSLVSSTGVWINGAAGVNVTLGLSSLPDAITPRTGAADGPYNNLYFGVNASDTDGVGMLSADYDLNTDATAGFDHVKINSAPAQLRFGRLKFSNAYGSELLDLPIPMETQYWNGTAFVTNNADNCTTLNVANMSLSNYQPATGALTAANMDTPTGSHISLGGAFIAGRGTLKLTKPSGTLTGRGSVTLTENLVAGSMTYLRGAWTGTSYTQNPSALAAFGVYKGANEFIYLRENY